MMDENFLLHKRRAHGTAGPHEGAAARRGRCTCSRRPTRSAQYTMRELVELGVSWVWMGLESPRSAYTKLKGADTHDAHARSCGSTASSCWARPSSGWSTTRRRTSTRRSSTRWRTTRTSTSSCSTRRCPGTPLFAEMSQRGPHARRTSTWRISTGSTQFNFQHAAISREDSKRFLDWAFRRDFERNGPSIYRICRTTLEGWRRYKNDPDPRVRGAFRMGGAVVARRLRGGAVGDGTRLQEDQREREPADSRAAPPGAERVSCRLATFGCGAGPDPVCGLRGAKKSAWPQARPTNRRYSSSARTGDRYRFEEQWHYNIRLRFIYDCSRN